MVLRTLSLILFFMIVVPGQALPAPRSELWQRWQAHDPVGTLRIDHSAWGEFLGKYLVADHPSGIHLLRYREVTPVDKRALTEYLDRLQAVAVSQLNRAEQKAYWINLYNALTIKVVLDHYPVKSIRDIDISPGFFSNGPWDAKLLRIEGEDLSLNDIEHRILRPIWRDPRLHYAVNCASLGCPNLQPEPYTAKNLENLLEKGAREYVNHPRGVQLQGKNLILSSIYNWFQEDFGGTERGVVKHISGHADPPLKMQLKSFTGQYTYRYDWTLNE